MYDFVDIHELGDSHFEPSDNMIINGVKLNEVIDGYRQLYVDGRQLVSRNVETTEVPQRNGQWFNYASENMRKLTIYFLIESKSSSELRDSFTKLNKYLRAERLLPIKFADEMDWEYYGVLSEVSSQPEQTLTVQGEFTLICPDPFKYKSVQSGRVGNLESDYVYPTKMVITVNRKTQELSITNGEQSIEFEGNYAPRDKITIEWGDELSIVRNGNNMLFELKQFTDIDFFKLYPNGTVSSPQATITELQWRDRTL